MRTPLYDWHVAHQARMVEFVGWDMPVQYTTITEEHRAVRSAVGLFDISHMGRLWLTGPDAEGLIQQVFTGNTAALKPGQVRYGLICNAEGGIRDDVLVYRWHDPGTWGMVVNASNRAKIVAWLTEHRDSRKVILHDPTAETCMIAVQGPQALELCRGLTETDPSSLRYYHAVMTHYRDQNCVLSRTGYTGEDGLEFVVSAGLALPLWEELVRRGARPCGLAARDTLRLEAAMPLYGHELTEEIDPFQAGLSWTVKMDKGDFIGREALARRQQDPTLRRRIGLELEGKRIAREGAVVRKDGRDVGRITSGTLAPTLNKVIAMAYVEPSLTEAGTSCEVDLRGQGVPARVVPLPFYRRPSN
jgi:aminomethyltransferase